MNQTQIRIVYRDGDIHDMIIPACTCMYPGLRIPRMIDNIPGFSYAYQDREMSLESGMLVFIESDDFEVDRNWKEQAP